MAQTITRSISIDVAQENRLQPIVAKQYDRASRFLNVQFLNMGTNMTVEQGATIVINAKRSDGQGLSFSGSVNSDGTVRVPITYWMLELDGPVVCDISIITGSSADTMLTSTSFTLEVQAAAVTNADVEENEDYPVLLELIHEVSEFEPELLDIRNGVHGQTFNSAGDAVRASADQLYNMKTGFDGVVYQSPEQMVTSCDQKLQNQINTLSGDLPITLTKVDGWYDNAGFHPNDQYQCATIQYNGNKIYVSTHANSAAKIAVYFSGVPGASTYISSQEAAYPADYGTLTVTDFELQIPNGTQYIVVNNRVNAGGFSAKEFTAEYFVDKVEALEDTIADVADAVTGYSNITDTLTVEDGYYRDKSGTKAQNSQYENVLIPVQAGEKYKITTAGNSVAVCIIFYNANPSETGHYVAHTPTEYPPNYGTLVINDYEITIADGVTYMAINNQKATAVLHVYKEIIIPVVDKLLSYQGKNILLLGDSITQLGTGSRGWARYFKEVVKPARMDNVAVIGAWWCDYNNSTVYNGNPQPVGDEQNVIGNQVQKIINNPSSFASSYDVIIIAAGTNDPTSTGMVTTAEINAQFYSNSDVVDLDDVDRSKWAGATRWVTEKLRTLFPTATIIYNTPVLRLDNHDCSRVLNNAAVIRRCADANSVLLCDTLKCGITMTDADDFVDGLHPSIQGAKKIGKYNARFFTKIFTDYIDE